MSDSLLSLVQMDYYIQCPLSERTMIVEAIELNTDIDDGTYATFTGRSLESILERRVVWGYYTYSGSMQTGIQQILTQNIISPTDAHRAINNFVFQASDNTSVTEIEYEFALFGDSVLDVVQEACQANDIGFKIVLNSSNQFVFSMYVGEDMSYGQSLVPWVIFSPTFDNLLSSKYYRTDVPKKTVAMVAGEGETESARTIVEATVDDGTKDDQTVIYKRRWGFKPNSTKPYTGGLGLNRKEIYTDASSVSKTYTDSLGVEHMLTDDEYANQLISKGQEDLSACYSTQIFEGETDYEGQFLYGRDYHIGDILQIENEYGITNAVRVEEVVNTIDESGQSVVPSFTAI